MDRPRHHTPRCPNHEHHGDWLDRHPCGWWSCGGGRGCGNCPDCYGEPCECHFIGPCDDTEEIDLDGEFPICQECIVGPLPLLEPSPWEGHEETNDGGVISDALGSDIPF
jgi:hypothetical protein